MIDEDKHAPVDQPGALLQCFDVAVWLKLHKQKSHNTIGLAKKVKAYFDSYLKLLLSM